jgi:phage tail protein X
VDLPTSNDLMKSGGLNMLNTVSGDTIERGLCWRKYVNSGVNIETLLLAMWQPVCSWLLLDENIEISFPPVLCLPQNCHGN